MQKKLLKQKYEMGNRIEKIKNYNQIILAIAGTIGVLFIFFAAFFVLVDMSSSFFDNASNNNNGVLATEKTNQLQKENLRKQIISFNKIQVIDSANQIFLIPVTQADLADAEKGNEVLGLMNTKSIGRSYDKFYGNIYNNLILYYKFTKESSIIFDKRISIEEFIIHESGQNKYVVIPASQIDSNKDGYLNEDDLQELFIYDIQKKSLHKIEAKENYTTLNVSQPNQSNDLVAHFGIDRNQDGVFESSTEPMIFYHINLEIMKIEEFIKPEQIEQLQSLLEGK